MFRFLKRPAQTREGDGDPARTALLRILELNKEMARATRPETLPDRILDAAIELVGAERGFLILRSPVVNSGAILPVRPSTERADGAQPEPEALAGESEAESEKGPPQSTGESAQRGWEVVAARNIDRENIRRALQKVSRSITAQVLETGRPFRSADAVNDESLSPRASVAELKLRSVLCVPMRLGSGAAPAAKSAARGAAMGEEVTGCVYVDNRFAHGQFDETSQEILEAFADQAALALERVRLLADNELVREHLEEANTELRRTLRDQAQAMDSLQHGLEPERVELAHAYPTLIGRGRAMTAMLAVVDRVVAGDFPVLLTGESGTGKELVARAMHEAGPRAAHPFVGVNCAAIAEGILESELFGAVKGAYTGSVRDRPGLVEAAQGGVLFLDEIGEMSLALQTKLLRVLQEKRVRRVGGNQEIGVDVRVVSATHRDLESEVESERFREDLYYRLKVVEIEVPALRGRREDIPALIEHFLRELCAKANRQVPAMTAACLERLVEHDWPGNVRELENEITRMVALGGDEIGLELVAHLSRSARPGAGSLRHFVGRRLDEVEAELIRATLEVTGGKRGEAARILGIPRRTFYNRLKALGIE